MGRAQGGAPKDAELVPRDRERERERGRTSQGKHNTQDMAAAAAIVAAAAPFLAVLPLVVLMLSQLSPSLFLLCFSCCCILPLPSGGLPLSSQAPLTRGQRGAAVSAPSRLVRDELPRQLLPL